MNFHSSKIVPLISLNWNKQRDIFCYKTDFNYEYGGICELASQFWTQPSLCFKRLSFDWSADKKGNNPHNDQDIVGILLSIFW